MAKARFGNTDNYACDAGAGADATPMLPDATLMLPDATLMLPDATLMLLAATSKRDMEAFLALFEKS